MASIASKALRGRRFSTSFGVSEIARADREGLCLYREGGRPQEGFQDLALLSGLVASFGSL